MSSEWVSLSIRRANRVSDGAGGKVETFVNIATGLQAHRRLYSRQSQWRLEAGVGVRTEAQVLFVLYGGSYPEVRPNDVIREESGAEYLVMFVAPYPHTLQIGTRRLT